MGELTDRAGRDGLADYDNWLRAAANHIDVESADIPTAATLVRRFELMLRAPDAIHLVICKRLRADLVTLDRRLATAAQVLDIGAVDLAGIAS